MKTIAAVSVVSLFAIPAVAQESMAQAAERQKKARTGQTKVITDADLRSNRSKAYSAAEVSGAAAQPTTPATSASPAATTPGAAPKSDDQVRAEKRAEIEKKIKQWNDFIVETRKAADQAQAEMNDLRDATLGNRRAGLQRIIDESNQHIAEAQQTIADLQEQARRSGIPVSR